MGKEQEIRWYTGGKEQEIRCEAGERRRRSGGRHGV